MLNTEFISTDDLQLTDFIENRNQQSMEYFYDKYSPALYGIIYRIINNTHIAEECLMATFVKAWNEIASFRPSDTTFFSWLINFARQAAIAALKLECERNLPADNFVYRANPSNSALELVYLKGFSLVEAAELCGTSVIELKRNIRMELKNMNDKTVQYDQ